MRGIDSHEFEQSKSVLLRADLNVPVLEVGTHMRASQAIDTIKRLRSMGKCVVIMSHYGRPHGPHAEYSLRGHADVLAAAIGEEVCFLPFGQFEPQCAITLLENTRFYKGEERNARRFTKKLAGTAEVFVQDAFSTTHRRHASVHRVATLMPAFAGPHLVREVSALSDSLTHHSVQLVLGGAKLETKVPLLKSLLPRVHGVFLGSYFLYAKLMLEGQNFPHIQISKQTLRAFKQLMVQYEHKLHFPKDVMLGDGRFVPVHDIPHDASIDDIGPETVAFLEDHIADAARVIWNGPLGKSVSGTYQASSVQAARLIANVRSSVLGGGDTISLLASEHIEPKGFVSAGGGAMLAFLESQDQPGLISLRI